MARDSGAQRTDYTSKTGEVGPTGSSRGYPKGSKEISSKPAEMIRGGGSGDGGGPTGSSRSYPKGGKANFSANFNPMHDKQRSGTDWVVGGV